MKNAVNCLWNVSFAAQSLVQHFVAAVFFKDERDVLVCASDGRRGEVIALWSTRTTNACAMACSRLGATRCKAPARWRWPEPVQPSMAAMPTRVSDWLWRS
jgi:hypothetical protein